MGFLSHEVVNGGCKRSRGGPERARARVTRAGMRGDKGGGSFLSRMGWCWVGPVIEKQKEHEKQ